MFGPPPRRPIDDGIEKPKSIKQIPQLEGLYRILIMLLLGIVPSKGGIKYLPLTANSQQKIYMYTFTQNLKLRQHYT